MDLVQAVLEPLPSHNPEGAGRRIRVVAGRILNLYQDRRRRDQGPPRTGGLARRRRLPTDLEPLVGSGQLWLASGFVVIHKSDVEGWKTGAMQLVSGNLRLFVVSLKPLQRSLPWRVYGMGRDPSQNPAWTVWEFQGVFHPSPDQIARLQLLFANSLTG